MKPIRKLLKLAAPAALLVALAAPLLPAWAQSQALAPAPASALTYPTAPTVDHVDTYHGTRVADPDRWLEDDNSAETKAWVQAQNAVTEKYFAAMPQRVPTRQLYTTMFNFERFGVPFKEGGRYFWTRNDGQARRGAGPEHAQQGRHRGADRHRAQPRRQAAGLWRGQGRF